MKTKYDIKLISVILSKEELATIPPKELNGYNSRSIYRADTLEDAREYVSNYRSIITDNMDGTYTADIYQIVEVAFHQLDGYVCTNTFYNIEFDAKSEKLREELI